MRRLLSVLLVPVLCTSVAVSAATPLQSYMEIKDGRHIITKTYEAAPDEDAALLIEDPFEQDGFSYTYLDTAKEEIPKVETKTATKEVTVSTSSNDAAMILQQLEPEVDYDGSDGFSGKLTLDTASLNTEVEGYTTKTYTLTDTLTLVGLSNNDSSNVPKTTTKSGVTLTLQSIDWQTHTADAIDYASIPTSYTAVAHYSGSYSKSVPTGYISTITYSGEVSKTSIEKVVYTLSYLGEEIPEPEPEPEPVIEDEQQSSPILWIVGIAICLAIIFGVLLLLLSLYHNTVIYLKNADEYSQIAKRHIKWSNPVVDLTKLDFAEKEVAVHVKKRIARKLFGRYIRTIAGGGFTTRCLVDNQNSDFWYIVNVPETPDAELLKDLESAEADLGTH